MRSDASIFEAIRARLFTAVIDDMIDGGETTAGVVDRSGIM